MQLYTEWDHVAPERSRGAHARFFERVHFWEAFDFATDFAVRLAPKAVDFHLAIQQWCQDRLGAQLS